MTKIPVFHSGLHFGEEPFVVGNECSGMVNFSGCHLACAHCYTPEATSGHFGEKLTAEAFEVRLEQLVDSGAKNLNLISPTHLWPSIEPSLQQFHARHPAVPIVLKMSGYEGTAFADRMAAVGDVLVPDFKVVSEEAAARCALPVSYGAVATRAIETWSRTHGAGETNSAGQLQRGIVVRHLLMPGFEADSRQVVSELAALRFPGWLNLMTRFMRPQGHGLVRAKEAFVEELVTQSIAVGIAIAIDGNPKNSNVGERGQHAYRG